MRQYLGFLEHILEKGIDKPDRTGTGIISTFGYQMRFNLQEGFPLLTTKKVHLKSIIHELLWFVKGDTSLRYLAENNVRIWNEWPYKKFTESADYNGETMAEYVELVRTNDEFCKKHGDLGPVYGKQWRDFEGYDQLGHIIEDIKHNPNSRRLLVSAWNPPRLKDMALPPCHLLFQFYVSDGKLSLQLYQRSADAFLGVPFNIASYAILLMMVADVCQLEPYEFIHTVGDAHIYKNHLEQVNLQLSRETRKLPKMVIKHQNHIEDFVYEDFKLEDYNPHPRIKGKVAV